MVAAAVACVMDRKSDRQMGAARQLRTPPLAHGCSAPSRRGRVAPATVRRDSRALRRAAVVAVTVFVVAAHPADARKINGTARADVLRGTNAADVIRGRGGDDRLSGRGGADRLFGGAGNDRMVGGPGKDRLDGATGKDRFACGRGGDTVLADARDQIGTDCERVLDARTKQPFMPAADVPGAQTPGAPTPPGKVCHLETRTVLVLEGVGSSAHYVLKPQVVVICVDGSQPGAGGGAPAPQCSDGRDNDSDLAVDFPADRGCESTADTTEYPDPISAFEQLLTSRGGFWWQPADPDGVCRLYFFRITPQGDRVGTQQAWFQNPISGICLLQTFAPSNPFTWSALDFTPPPASTFPLIGKEIRLQTVGGSIVPLWMWAHSPAEDGILFTTGAPPGQAGEVRKIMWGCTSVSYPAEFRSPACG